MTGGIHSMSKRSSLVHMPKRKAQTSQKVGGVEGSHRLCLARTMMTRFKQGMAYCKNITAPPNLYLDQPKQMRVDVEKELQM